MAEHVERGPYRAPPNMNWGALALGGLAAGAVIELAAYLAGRMGVEQMQLAGMISSAVAASAGTPEGTETEPPPEPRLFLLVLIGIGLGFFIAWLYAAIRPRFGPGPATALRVAAFFWLFLQGLGFVFHLAVGLEVTAIDLITRIFFFVAYALAALAAGLLYWETPDSRHRRESGRWPTSS